MSFQYGSIQLFGCTFNKETVVVNDCDIVAFHGQPFCQMEPDITGTDN